jgi:hypothetical protein
MGTARRALVPEPVVTGDQPVQRWARACEHTLGGQFGHAIYGIAEQRRARCRPPAEHRMTGPLPSVRMSDVPESAR